VTQKTSIEWADKSSNPLRAYHVETGKRGWFCVHASEGCRNCYAERRNRWIGNGLLYRAQDAKLVRFEMDVEELRAWQRLPEGARVFAFDMTDLFQEGVHDHLIDQAFAAMGTSPATFLILTKRALRARLFVADWYRRTQTPLLQNVWLGTSVEDQATAAHRIADLVKTPAAVRFVSYEPALGPVDFSEWLHGQTCSTCGLFQYIPGQCLRCRSRVSRRGLHWIIVGGESGRARPFDVAWARATVEACKAAGAAVFVKQLGNVPVMAEADWRALEPVPVLNARNHKRAPAGTVPLLLTGKKGGDPAEWPADLRVREFPR
jgi:protein gp37